MYAKAPKLDPYSIWLIARCVAGFTVSPDDSTPESFDILAEMQVINHQWRIQVLQRKYPEVAALVATVDPASPAPAAPKIIKLDSNLINANDLKYLTKPEYALSEYAIYLKGFNALVGPSGAGKSFVALDAAALLACAGATVIYVAGEGLHGFSGRWEAWKDYHQLDSDNLIFFKRAVNMMDTADTSAFLSEIRGYKPVLVVYDTVARCMAGSDENSTRDMSMFVSSVDFIMRELDAGALLVHHTGKDGKMRGNTALYAACDSVLFLQRLEDSICVHNSFEQGGKNKHLAEASPRYMKLLPRPIQIEGVDYESAVLVDAKHIDKNLTVLTDPLSESQRRILEAVEGYEQGLAFMSIMDATGISKSTLHRKLKELLQSKRLVCVDDRYSITKAGLEAMQGE